MSIARHLRRSAARGLQFTIDDAGLARRVGSEPAPVESRKPVVLELPASAWGLEISVTPETP